MYNLYTDANSHVNCVCILALRKRLPARCCAVLSNALVGFELLGGRIKVVYYNSG